MSDAKGAKVAKRSVYYDFDKSDIKPEQLSTVEANARYLRDQQALKVRVEGNADERGSREYNLALGQKRAESVAKTMRLLGVPESRMESVSYGAERPRASGHDEQSWSENRRADIVYP
jgi:peptidoglycan-associated lipoprotein